MKLIETIGRYVELMATVFSKPMKRKIFFRRLIDEIEQIGVDSIWIVSIVSIFMGAVLALQVSLNFVSPIFPRYLIGLGVRDTMILEFSSTVICLILAGKVGSNIASEIGTMKITEQVDALEIMGVNSASYLILPKIIAALITFPLLNLLSGFLGIIGGIVVALTTNVVSLHDYLYGITSYFIPFYITYSLIKIAVFSFIITSVSAFHGYNTNGGALEVGKSSTRAVVYSIILILLFNLVLTQLLLT